jgi:diacylglycerol kinase
MKDVIQSHHPARTAKSFKYAFKGIGHAMLNEANFRIQLIVAIGSIILGLYFEISNVEWGLLVLSMGFLLSAEMVNTVVEEFVDHLIKEENDGARIIKDLSAGFVLTAAITTFIILLLVFGEYILDLVP